MGTAARVERRIASEGGAEIGDEIDEIGARVNPVLEIREGDEARGGHVRVGPLDDHVGGGVDVDAGRVARVGLEEPDDDGDVVGDAVVRHRDGSVRLEEVYGSAVVVDKRRRFGLEGRVGRD